MRQPKPLRVARRAELEGMGDVATRASTAALCRIGHGQHRNPAPRRAPLGWRI